MEFLGDSIMQLVATEYLFIHFPDHHEGHLTVRRGAHLLHSVLFGAPQDTDCGSKPTPRSTAGSIDVCDDVIVCI